MCYTILIKPVELVKIHNTDRKRWGWRQKKAKRTGSVFLSWGWERLELRAPCSYSTFRPGSYTGSLTVPGCYALTWARPLLKRESPQSCVPGKGSSTPLLLPSARAPRGQGLWLLIWGAPVEPSMVFYTEISTGLHLSSNYLTSVVIIKSWLPILLQALYKLCNV